MAEEVQSLEELQANLSEYQEQLKQVEQLVEVEPDNDEYQEMLNSLKEVIELTSDLISEQQQSAVGQAAAPAPARKASRWGAAPAPAAPAVSAAVPATTADAVARAAQAAAAQVAVPNTAALPPIVAEQIKAAQARQARLALSGEAPAHLAVGHPCQACYTDGEWYDAVVQSLTQTGAFMIKYDGYEELEEVAFPNIRPPPEVEEVYKGVSAPKRRKVEEESKPVEIPKSLEILPTDSEKEVMRKKKALKKLKSERRFQQMDNAQKQRQNSWLDFQKGKGKSKKSKTGGPTFKRKESIFKTPDNIDGKVGVIGSGRGVTEYNKRGRHEFSSDAA